MILSLKKELEKIYIFFVMLILAGSSTAVFSQEDMPSDTLEQKKNQKMVMKNPEGRDFWLCFEKNYREPKSPSASNRLQLEFFITGNKDANVRIQIKGIGYDESFFVPGGTVRNVKLPPEAEIKNDEIIEQLAVHVTSDVPVSIYGLNRRFQTTDTYLGLPVKVLGTEYRTMCYNISVGYTPEFAVVATEDSTIVNITPTVRTIKHPAGETFVVRMNKGEVYQVQSADEKFMTCDLTGSLIRANKKIAVFSGHQCAYVPPKIIACNHLVEQMPPIPSWGKHFYLGMLKPRSNFTYRVLANENGTKVFENSKLMKILKAGDFFENTVTNNIQVTASKPVLVAQYSQGFRNGDSIGDPMMLLCSPTQQFLKEYRFATPVNGFWKHYVNVVVPTKYIKTLTLDGNPVDSSMFQSLGLSRYSIAHINVPFGSHSLKAAVPFGMYSYGFGYDKDAFDAYGTMGGQSFIEYEPEKDTLPPVANIKEKEGPPEPGRTTIIVRDDNVNDSGLRDISFLTKEGVKVKTPSFEEGILQVQFSVEAENPAAPGRLVINATDMALNNSIYTLCYVYDDETESFVYKLNPGEVEDCEVDPGIEIGPFLKISYVNHSADFSKTDGLNPVGTFGDASGMGGFAGIYIGRRIKSNLELSGRISFENYGGILEAPGKIDSIRNPDGGLRPFQESNLLELTGLSMHIGLTAEYYLRNNIYALGGVNIAFTLSDAINYERQILIPSNYTYSNGKRKINEPGSPENLSSINSMRLGLFGGMGVNYQLNSFLAIFGEGIYTYHLGSLIDDGDWFISQLSFQLGLKYRVQIK